MTQHPGALWSVNTLHGSVRSVHILTASKRGLHGTYVLWQWRQRTVSYGWLLKVLGVLTAKDFVLWNCVFYVKKKPKGHEAGNREIHRQGMVTKPTYIYIYLILKTLYACYIFRPLLWPSSRCKNWGWLEQWPQHVGGILTL
jgi:hypothetical protein